MNRSAGQWDAGAQAERWSPAHVAVENEDLPALARLMDDGADVEDADVHGFTLLLHAIDVEVDGAAQTGGTLHVDTTAFLLARGADPGLDDDLGSLHTARTRGHWLAAELLKAWIARGHPA